MNVISFVMVLKILQVEKPSKFEYHDDIWKCDTVTSAVKIFGKVLVFIVFFFTQPLKLSIV